MTTSRGAVAWPGRAFPALLLCCAALLSGCETLAARKAAPEPDVEAVAALARHANQAYRAGDWATAESDYARLTAIVPGNAEQWFRRGNASAHLGRLGDAVACYGETLRLDPKHAGAWHNLGMAHLQLAARAFTGLEGNADEAEMARARRIIEGVTDMLAREQDGAEPLPLELESLKVQ